MTLKRSFPLPEPAGFGVLPHACYTKKVVAVKLLEEVSYPPGSTGNQREDAAKFALRPDSSVVERGPEKAGVGGSIPSLATTSFFFLFKLFFPKASPALAELCVFFCMLSHRNT